MAKSNATQITFGDGSLTLPDGWSETKREPERLTSSAITSKPATRDRLKSGHFVSFGDAVNYFELESFVKLAAL